MTTLAEHDRSLQAHLTPTEKFTQALDMMEEGLKLQRANLARRHPDASPEQLEALYRQWLFADEWREDLALIAARGYDRDENLGEKLDRLLAELAS